MLPAPKYGAFEPRRFAAPDPRADGRRRFVRLDGDQVAINRVVAGISMRVTVPTSAYRGVALRVVDARDDGFAYEIRLVHADPDLSVALAETSDDSDIQAEWRLWARVLGLPALVERAEGCDEPDEQLLGRVAIRPSTPRRRGKTILSRRPRFLARRRLGRPELGVKVEKVEELSGGADPER
jgi:hypothetical protein